MKLKKLINGLNIKLSNDIKNININRIANSTDDVKEDCLFICIKGQKVDGHSLKQKAKEKGAIAFLVEEVDKEFDGIQICVPNTRKALSLIAQNFYKPKNKIKVIGLTGTNGKTTTSFMLAEILKCAGKNVGVIGTIGIYYGGRIEQATLTTPDPIELFKTIKTMSEAGVDVVIMEVSAHAIYLNKVEGINFYAKGITNISEDHLDFFESMEQYEKVKLEFMKVGKCVKAVNVDDKVIRSTPINNKTIFYGINSEANIMAKEISEDSSCFKICYKNNKVNVKWKMFGRYNIENALCASSIAFGIGIKAKSIEQGLNGFKSVPGRMNVYVKDGKKSIIDFAHTPDAMEKIIKTAKEFTSGNLVCVFGCGGNRDSLKRPIMGEIASRLCDYVYITNDNPRFENAEDIANMIKSGIKGNNYEIILDRKFAIEKALSGLSDGDVALILGKGAESYMEINGEKYFYSDKEEAEKWGFKCL